MKTGLPWRKAIIKVLNSSDDAMHYKDIANHIISDGLRRKVGATPAMTVSANLTTSIAKEGDKSPFQKVGRGEYILRQIPSKKTKGSKISEKEKAIRISAESDDQYGIVSQLVGIDSHGLVYCLFLMQANWVKCRMNITHLKLLQPLKRSL